MSQPLQLSLGVQDAVNNQYLFSDHYLSDLLPQDARWQEALPFAAGFLAWLQALYAHEQAQLAAYNEAQLEEHWIRPILKQLGHIWEPQPSVPGLQTGVKRPDYVFFATEAERQAAATVQNSSAYGAHALAAGEVKEWKRSLDKKEKGGGATFDSQNPGYQIDYYVRALEVEWGILSNGRLWRLVQRDSSQKLAVYYEVDLVELLQSGDAGKMRYFTLFFRQGALLPDAQGRRFLHDALAASQAYAVQLEEDMQDNVYRALELLMQGFMDHPDNGLGAGDLRAVYDNSLYLLYRLLFILYAESRGLLPLQHEQYREHYSLHDIKNDIAAGDAPTMPNTGVFWSRVQTLFAIIDGHNPQLNEGLGVPRYNGGLFSPRLHPFLREKVVGDGYLTRAIDLLSRRQVGPDATQKEFADYRTLGVRQLGSIYEGLLEYQPRLAAEEMVAVRQGGKDERWLPAKEAGAGATVIARREAGQVYLATDRGERKATGSYYTPEYIVQYIVENTLGPLVEEARRRVEARAAAARGKAAQEAARQGLVDELLALRCLDPAMGSGHFLVYATDYLALALATDPHLQPAATAEDDLVYWKRRVVERCIYGVDRNPLAVELAKLSLWLNTVAVDRPLSFLDHHLKCGDSLVGAEVRDLGWSPPPILTKKQAQRQQAQREAGQMDLFSQRLAEQLPNMMLSILDITRRESDSYESVQEKEAADRTVRQLRAPFEAIADLWTSAYFGNSFTPAEYAEALEQIQRPTRLLAQPAVQRALAISRADWREMLKLWHVALLEAEDGGPPQAAQPAEARRFFHWQLAFPEVFFDQNGQPLGEKAGFDAVVGNPPYDELSELERGGVISEMALFEDSQVYAPALGNRVNLFRLFICQALNILSHGGWHGFIVPMSLLADQFTLNLRRFLLKNVSIKLIEQFPQKDNRLDRVFLDAKLSTCLYVLNNVVPKKGVTLFVRTHPGRQIVELSPSYTTEQDSFFEFDPHNLSIPGLSANAWNLVLRLATLGRLGDYAKAATGELMINRQFEPYIANYGMGEEVIRGSYISMYKIVDPKQGDTLYVNRSKYLEDHQASSKAFHHKASRVVYQRYAAIDNYRRLIATILPAGYFCSHTVGYLTDVEDVKQEFLLALLNSELLDWRFNLTSTNNNINGYEVEGLPVPVISFTTPPSDRAAYLEKAKKLYTQYCEKDDLACVTGFVAHHLQKGQSDVVHDLLAFLAEEMMAMNKEKQQMTEAFWLDLEGVTAAGTFETLRNKGRWESSLWKDAALRPFVDENSRSTRTLDESLGWNVAAFKAFVKQLAGSVPNLSALVDAYQQHATDYGALTARLAATDRLIDEVVYQLYGLTDEEIAIVEGA